MYDDLARTQDSPPLEWLVVHAVIPSLALTLFLQVEGTSMRAFSSVASIAGHVALGAAVLFSTTKVGRSDLARPVERTIIFPPAARVDENGGLSIPGPVRVVAPDVNLIAVPSTLPATGGLMPSFSVFSSPAVGAGPTQPGVANDMWSEERAEVLTGPLPVYPELLRQAGVQGRVVFEAVVDSTGRVLATTVVVVAATHPAFVAPARQALLATLFRPAMVGGKAIRVRVRIPYEFAIRIGIGRAR